MMSDTQKTLFQFWSRFGVPCYIQGSVDDEQPLPYIVYTVDDGNAFDETVLTAYVYAKEDAEGISARRHIMDAVSVAVPYQGTRVGNLVLYRNGGGWQSIGKEDTTVNVVYGRISLQANYYNV